MKQRWAQWLCYLAVLFCATVQAAWSPPEEVSQSTDSFFRLPNVVLDSQGNATAVWIRGTNTVQASSRPFGGSWEPAVTLGGGDWAPEMVVDGQGNVTAVWFNLPSSTDKGIQAATKPFNGTWSSTKIVFPYELGNEITQQKLAVDPYGNVMAVWSYGDDTQYVIYAAMKTVGEEDWSAPEAVATISYDDGNFENVGIAFDGAGNATAIWIASDGSTWTVQSSTKNFGGSSWSAAATIASSTFISGFPVIGVDQAGNATAMWVGRNDSGFATIYSSNRPSGGSWRPAEQVSLGGSVNIDPHMVVDSVGNITAVWVSANTDLSVRRIQTSTKPFGGSWSTPQFLSPEDQLVSSLYFPLAVDSGGNVTAGWRQFEGSNSWVQSAGKPFGADWQLPGEVVSIKTLTQEPAIAANAAGWVMAVWPSQDGDDRYLESAIKGPLPLISLLEPNSGPPAGGTTVVITGENFIDVLGVLFGSVPSATVTVDSPTSIRAVAPPGTAGTVDVRVITAGGTSLITPNGRYTYQSQEPKPPCAFKGKLHKRDHYHKHRYRLKTTWKKSPTEGVAFYRIYKRSHLVKTVAAHKKRAYSTHLRWRSSTKKFRITAVTENNVESARKKLKVKH